MDQLPAMLQPRHLPDSPDTAQTLAELRRAVPEFRRAVRARALEIALEDIDRSFTEALAGLRPKPGVTAKEVEAVEAVVQRVEAVQEVVKRPLLQQLGDTIGDTIQHDPEVTAHKKALHARHRRAEGTPLSEPVVKTVASAVGPIAAKPDPPIVPLHVVRGV